MSKTKSTKAKGPALEPNVVTEVPIGAMRRSDPEYCMSHDCEPCSDEDWDTAIAAGEDALEANQ